MLLPAACTLADRRQTDEDGLDQFVERPPDRASEAMRWASECQLEIERQLDRLSTTGTQAQVQVRLAQALRSLAERTGPASSGEGRRWIRMTHQELAYVSISSLEATTRTLEDFAREGLITQARGRIRLDRPDLLSKIVDAGRVGFTMLPPPAAWTDVSTHTARLRPPRSHRLLRIAA